jgi:Fic family protein
MIFATPVPTPRALEVIAEIDQLKSKLRWQLHEPRRWFGSLRRLSVARAIQGSNSIEGYTAALDDAAAVGVGEEPLDADEETRLALKAYRDAMTYVLQLAGDENFGYSEQLLKSLHFMMTSYDLKVRPGLWRAGDIFVRHEDTGETVYEGVDVDELAPLMSELVARINDEPDVPPMIRAGMAHLNLVLVHPFKDGNGRMGRCLQTLVLAREGILSPAFCSIEEYLGRNTQAYYDVLAAVGGGRWHPENDATPWVRFILTAHLRQASTMLRRVKESERLWADLEALARARHLPERSVSGLFDAATGFRLRNAIYRVIAAENEDEGLTEATATRDLRQMVDSGLLEPRGEKRGRFYVGSPELRAVQAAIIGARDPRDDSDPFASSA